jgi:S1-C subfamily serine protease
MAGGNIGIGFAIPSHMVQKVVAQLRDHGEVRRGQLGIVIQDVTPGLAEALDLGVDQGALVAEVQPGSAAEMAGIEIGDVVVAIDADPVQSSAALRNAVGLVRLGERVTLTVVRDGETTTIEAPVGVPQADEDTAATPAPRAPSALDGVEFADLPSNHSLAGEGVLVADVVQDSHAWLQGLRPNDVVTAVNRREVDSVAELAAALEESDPPLALLVHRGDRRLFVLIDGG